MPHCLKSHALAHIIHGCRKLSFQIRFVTYNLLASYILFEFMIILHSVAMLFFGDLYHKQIYDSRTFFSCALVATLWSSLCAVTVERLVALTIPLHYNRYVTKTTLSISVACLWTVTILPPSLTYTITGVKVCGQHHYISCDMHAHFQSTALVIISFLLLYALIISISYIKILSIILHHHSLGRTLKDNTKYLADISKKQKSTDSTKTVAAVILACILFLSPIFVHVVLIEFKPELWGHKWRSIFQVLDFVGIQLNTYANLYLYVCKFKECKMRFYFILAKFNGKFKAKADSLYIEVFDIVVLEKKRGDIKAVADSTM